MAVDTSAIGKPTSACRASVERTPVDHFASAVLDENPIYHRVEAATAAGFEAIPAPPTYTFTLINNGAFRELQPPDPTGGQNPMHKIMGELFARGGMVLHGEQEFSYHRPVLVGDVLVGEGTVVDLYEKESKGSTMTFIVTETVWRDERSGDPVVTERFNLIHRR